MFHERSYDRHSQSFARDLIDPDRKKIAASWYDASTIDAWRHSRGYEIASHLGGVEGETWVTVGDGRFGLDSIRLMERGVAKALATDIDETLLRAAKANGRLTDYCVENAENLSFQDSSFDYVFCKESLHHFPRPAIALYEMLRVSRKGIVLVEPNDRYSSPRRILGVLARTLLGKKRGHMDLGAYEEDGNYIFSISPREIEKVAMAIDMPHVAFKGLNDHYEPGVEFEPVDSSRARKVMSIVKRRDYQCRIGFENYQLLMAVMFHISPSSAQRRSMMEAGWRFVDLPRNPYIRASTIS
jgi:SAM-dependent methyltransferase